jgi:hypothetical protein
LNTLTPTPLPRVGEGKCHPSPLPLSQAKERGIASSDPNLLCARERGIAHAVGEGKCSCSGREEVLMQWERGSAHAVGEGGAHNLMAVTRGSTAITL